uniref:Uncharacterized protein n=1 Tax=Timema monikensis TaxID=170555 RepID=A0A7R9E9P1_9NEOP|nr:unnamed protein product [Timema monikensis]
MTPLIKEGLVNWSSLARPGIRMCTQDRNHHSHKSGGDACKDLSGKDATSEENKMAVMWETVNKLGKDTYNVTDNESRSEKKDASKKPRIVDLCEEDQKRIIHLLEGLAKRVSEVNDLKDKISKMAKEKSDLRCQQSMITANYKEECQRLHNELLSEKGQCTQLVEENNRMIKEKELILQENCELKSKVQHLNDEKDELSKLVVEKDTRLTKCKNDLETFRKRQKDLDQQLVDGNKTMADFKKQTEDLIKELADCRPNLEDGHRQLVHCRRQLAECRQQLVTSEKRLADQEGQRVGLEVQLANSNRELANCIENMSDYTRRWMDCMKELDHHKKQLENKEEQMAHCDKKLANSKEALDDCTRQLEDKQKLITLHEKHLANYRNEVEDYKRQLTENGKQLVEHQERIKTYRNELELNSKQLADYEMKLKVDQKQLSENTERTSADQKRFSDNASRIEYYEKQLLESKRQIKNHKKQMTDYKRQLAESNKQLGEAAEIICKMKYNPKRAEPTSNHNINQATQTEELETFGKKSSSDTSLKTITINSPESENSLLSELFFPTPPLPNQVQDIFFLAPTRSSRDMFLP